MSDSKIVSVPVAESPEDKVHRQRAEAARLANLAPGEWQLWIDDSANGLGIPRATLETSVKAIIREREKAEVDARREEKLRERRVEQQRREAQRAKERAQEREQRRIETEAASKRKVKEKEKEFKILLDLPSEQLEARVVDLAKRLGEDVEIVREEFDEFAALVGSDARDDAIEPWPEPVATQELLLELMTQIGRYVVIRDEAAIAVSLWVMFAWVHNAIATHSPLLMVTSAEKDSGKTTLLGVLGFQVPKPFTVVEPNGPNIYRIVDHDHPTLIVDEADELFSRKTDVMHVVNAGWTRGTKIPRMVRGVIHQFDPFCPKILGLKGMAVPDTTASRGIVVKLWPKTPDERISDFDHTDNDEFLVLRRKLARWSADNAAVLKDSRPAFPAGFGNRLAANWKLLLAIAEHAGGAWPQRARQAAVKLSHRAYEPSAGVRLLAALRPMFAAAQELTSEEIIKRLVADPDEEWKEFRGHTPITQRQVAALLKNYEVHPTVLHPTRRAVLSRRGYRRVQFADAFARFLGSGPNIRTRKPKPKPKRGRKRGRT